MDYYRGLIDLRKTYATFCRTERKQFEFFLGNHSNCLGFMIRADHSPDHKDIVVLLNGHGHASAQFAIPEGPWKVLVDGSRAGTKALRQIKGRQLSLMPATGMVLAK